MKKKILSLFLTLCIFVLPITLSGCGKEKSTPVSVAVDTDEQAEIFKEAAKEYEKEENKTVNIITVAERGEEKAKLLDGNSDKPTVFLLSDISEYEDLKEYCEDIEGSSLNSYLYSKKLAIKSEDGEKTYAIPFDISGYGIVINREILDKYFKLKNSDAGYNSIDDITDFKTLKNLVVDLNEKKEELGIESVFASPGLSDSDAYEWHSGIMNTPLYYEFSKNDDYYNADEAFYKSKEIDFRYDNEYKEILDLITGNSTDKTAFETKTEKDALEEFKSGKAAMLIGTDKMMFDDIKNDGKKLAFIPLYTDISGENNQGITIKREKFFAVNSKASDDEKQAAINFIDWLFSSDNGKKIVTTELSVLTPFNTFNDEDLPEHTLKRETVKSLKDDNTENILWVLSTPVREVTKGATNLALNAYIAGKKTFDETKNELKERWKAANR